MRIGIVGCGYVADTYIESLQRYPQLELVAVTDRNRERAQAFGKYYDSTAKADVIITFTSDGAKLWQEITRCNINKSIAIVLDDEVYYAPKVMFEIKKGKCRISGAFSTDDVNRLIALINNKELPLVFKLTD